ncbi:MAG: hypothetical protein OEZ54_11950, partial [Gemmatimonadota bacterium]|nr:hypothetical protein [Gemmatimonadota bacterium]
MNAARRKEHGFALPMTLLLVTIITVMLTSMFTRTYNDRIISTATESSMDAVVLAQYGLQKYLSDTFVSRPRSNDSLRYNLTGGYVWVNPQVIKTPSDTLQPYTYVLTARSYVINPLEGSTVLATRTVAHFANWQTGVMNELGALTAANGMKIRAGGYEFLTGTDITTCYSGETVPFVRQPSSGATPNADSTIGAYLASGTALELATALGIDWAAIENGDFDADYTTFRAWDGSYPTILIQGNYDIKDTGGYGLLIVTGNVRLQSSWAYWSGVIIAGGRVNFDAGWTYVNGAV